MSDDGEGEGRQTVRVEEGRGPSLAGRVAAGAQRLTWRTPLHAMRLRGRYPLQLLGAPGDPIAGTIRAGRALLEGRMMLGHEAVAIEAIAASPLSPALADHVQSFAWLRDLAAAAPREEAAPVAETIMRGWLAAHAGEVRDAAWRPDRWGRRILFWTAHAPLILSSGDGDYRKAVLNTLARGARHLDRAADSAAQGLPRIMAWAGVIAAGLLIPGGDLRVAHGEAGMARALGLAVYEDGGLAARSPTAQLRLIETLAMLRPIYAFRERDLPEPVERALAGAVPALAAVTMGDGALSSWQGGGPGRAERVAAVIAASGIPARPLAAPRDWGYQRLAAGRAVLVLDAAPPPVAQLAAGGCASTLAFEFSDGEQRLIVNCGGASGLPAAFGEALRTTAAHSTLVLADANSTAVHADGTLGKGVGEVELDRRDGPNHSGAGGMIEASHDGYVRRRGLRHRRRLALDGDGRGLAGEDRLEPAGRRRGEAAPFAIRFHLAPGIAVTPTADGRGALLRPAESAAWQFRADGGVLSVEDSVWIDPGGRPRGTQQLVVSGETGAEGVAVAWSLRRAG